MSDSEKVNVYPSPHLRQLLNNDIELFEIFKKDRGESIMEINTSGFMNKFLLGYFEKYKQEIGEYTADLDEHLKKAELKEYEINEIKNFLLNKIIFLEKNDSPMNKCSSSKTTIPFKTNDNTTSIIQELNSGGLKGCSLSEYLCRMLKLYFKKPLYKREQIIFSKEYEAIFNNCKKQCIKFNYLYDNKEYTVVPYTIFTGKEQMFNYVFCYGFDSNKQVRTYSFRLNRISNIKPSYQTITCPDDIEEKFRLTKQLGASYAINDTLEESCILLNPQGISSFKHIYFGRPTVDSKKAAPDGNFKYYFKCSTEQLYRYFRRFNPGEAVVEYPASLRDRIIEFHKESLNGYKNLKVSE